MDLIQAALLAALQGITEWLPISSSGHLLIAQQLMGIEVPVAFDIVLHLGTLIAVTLFFRKEIWSILKSLLEPSRLNPDFMTAVYIVIASIPTAAVGLLIGRYEGIFVTGRSVALGLLASALLLFLSKLGKGKKQLGATGAAVIGIFQGIAVAPGISRSGATISSALLFGIKKEEAFKFSMLLSIPALIGAAAIKAGEVVSAGLLPESAVGVTVSAAVGYLAIALLKKALLSERLFLFGFYCLAVGSVALILL